LLAVLAATSVTAQETTAPAVANVEPLTSATLAAVDHHTSLTIPAGKITQPPTGEKVPAVAPDAEETTAPAEVAAPKRGFGAPDWLVEGTRADDWSEKAAPRARTRPYDESVATQSHHMAQPRAYQPTGSLTGRVVYAMAGHGWTYEEDRQVYYTQRSLAHGIIEDLGNLDQMHIFAHLCWNSGATVVPLRPIDHQPEERILDNTSAQTTFYGNWYPSNSIIHHGNRGDSVPYMYAYASTEESAVARFRPYIPTPGEYPVYAWARDGGDRVSGQLYRVAHAGGVTEIRVNHRRVGKGWVWLGTFYFEAGDRGYVDVSNHVPDPYDVQGNRVVVADGIRFGNGRGDVPRPIGRSGFLREDEGDAYWIERSLGPTADPRFYTAPRDGQATISSPPRTAAYMNREADGRYLERVLISFHSNALAGQSRGVVALFNQSPTQRPDHQELLAKFIGSQINREMLADPPFASPRWASRDRTTYNGINFGELRKDYLQNEMCATIVEVGFHDNADDAKFLLDPRARISMARATLRGMLRWIAELRGPNAAIPMLPTPPTDPVARSIPGGRLLLTWTPGEYGRVAGDPPTEYRVYRSRDGFSFDAGIMSEGEESMVVDPVTSSGPTFLRVTALNAGGESWPSQVVAAVTPEVADAISSNTYAAASIAAQNGSTTTTLPRPSTLGRVLLVAGITSLDATTNQRQEIEDFSSRPGNTVTTWRVRPRTLLNAPRMDAAADALTSAGRVFDSCNSAAVANGRVPLNEYNTIVWCVGRQNPQGGILTSPTQALLSRFMQGGGKLFINGAHLAQALDGPAPLAAPTQQDRNFLRNVLGARYVSSNTELRTVAAIPGGAFANFSDFNLSAGGTNGMVDALPSDVITAGAGTGEVLRYKTSGTSTAAIAGGRGATKTRGSLVLFAFPFENIIGTEPRARVMHSVLQYLQ